MFWWNGGELSTVEVIFLLMMAFLSKFFLVVTCRGFEMGSDLLETITLLK